MSNPALVTLHLPHGVFPTSIGKLLELALLVKNRVSIECYAFAPSRRYTAIIKHDGIPLIMFNLGTFAAAYDENMADFYLYGEEDDLVWLKLMSDMPLKLERFDD